MKPKLLLIVGLAIGYVLGARAGRSRYNQIAKKTDELWNSPRVTKARVEAERYARAQAPVIKAKAEAVAKAAPGALADAADRTATLAKDVADKTASVAKDVADKTAGAAKDVADKTVEAAKGVADRTTSTARDVAGKTTTTAKDVASKTTTTARGAADRTVAAATDAAGRIGEARDKLLEDEVDDDEDIAVDDDRP
jgi:hypothetical protein